MNVPTFSDWMKYHPTPQQLQTNKDENFNRIISWGLYTLPHIFLDSQSYKEDIVKSFCSHWKDRNFSVRALPKTPKLLRGTRLDLQDYSEVISVIRDFLSKGKDYIFLIAAYSHRTLVGNIIVSEHGHVLVEVMPSSHHPDVTVGATDVVLDYRDDQKSNGCIFSGKRILFISGVDWFGKIVHHPQMPEEIRRVIGQSLRRIRVTRTLYLPGYYEFVYSPIDGLSFIDAIFEKGYTLDWNRE